MKRIRRHLAFIQSILKEANRYKGEELLTHASADQINALSEVVLNLLKKNIPTPSGKTLKRLKPHKNQLREIAKRKNSVKRRRQLFKSQTGGNFWKGLEEVCHCIYK